MNSTKLNLLRSIHTLFSMKRENLQYLMLIRFLGSLGVIFRIEMRVVFRFRKAREGDMQLASERLQSFF